MEKSPSHLGIGGPSLLGIADSSHLELGGSLLHLRFGVFSHLRLGDFALTSNYVTRFLYAGAFLLPLIDSSVLSGNCLTSSWFTNFTPCIRRLTSAWAKLDISDSDQRGLTGFDAPTSCSKKRVGWAFLLWTPRPILLVNSAGQKGQRKVTSRTPNEEMSCKVAATEDTPRSVFLIFLRDVATVVSQVTEC